VPRYFPGWKTLWKRQATTAGQNAGFQPAFGPARANPPASTHSCPPFIKSRQPVQPLKGIPSLDDWEQEGVENSHRNVQPKLLPVDFPDKPPGWCLDVKLNLSLLMGNK
jgi:hypothetical protein